MEKWDAIVVGGGLGGLVCGAFLTKAGKKVLLLEMRSNIGGRATSAFLRLAAGMISDSLSLPTDGFTVQTIPPGSYAVSTHLSQLRHRRIFSNSPRRALLGNSGSATNALQSPIKSAFFVSRTSSAS